VRGDTAQAADVVAFSLDPSLLLLDSVGHAKGRGKIRIDCAAAAAQPLTGASNGVPRPGAAPGGRRVNRGRVEPSAAGVSEAARSVRDPSSSKRCLLVVRQAAVSDPSRRPTEGACLVGASGASNGGVLRVVVQRGGSALLLPSEVPLSQLPTNVGPIVGSGTGRTRMPHGHGIGRSFSSIAYFCLVCCCSCYLASRLRERVFEKIFRKSFFSACLVASRLETDASRLETDASRLIASRLVASRLVASRFVAKKVFRESCFPLACLSILWVNGWRGFRLVACRLLVGILRFSCYEDNSQDVPAVVYCFPDGYLLVWCSCIRKIRCG